MFAVQWREFSPPLSSARRLLQCYHRKKSDRRRCNSRGIPPQPPAPRAISQWASSLEWRHAVTLHILVGKICINFFLFYCEGMLSLVVLWLCGCPSQVCECRSDVSRVLGAWIGDCNSCAVFVHGNRPILLRFLPTPVILSTTLPPPPHNAGLLATKHLTAVVSGVQSLCAPISSFPGK